MLTTVGQLEIFSEDSVIGFDRWSETFEIYLKAMGRNWTEPEKVARIGLALKDTPWEIFRKLTDEEKASVKNALKALREKLNSPHRRELAKRTLALCKQREDANLVHLIALGNIFEGGNFLRRRPVSVSFYLLDSLTGRLNYPSLIIKKSRLRRARRKFLIEFQR